MSISEIYQQTKGLTSEERSALISNLIDDLGTPRHDVSDQEVLQRIKDTNDGTARDISHDELLEGLKFIPRR
ncbi:MAG: hypothetical protein AAF226_13425 [Verrucomicrobiota bacterium]